MIQTLPDITEQQKCNLSKYGHENIKINVEHPATSTKHPNNDMLCVNLVNDKPYDRFVTSPSRNGNLKSSSKGLHLCNLNVRHLTPKLDEIRLAMAEENGPDIFGLCETFLDDGVQDCQIKIKGFDFIRKDRSDTQRKCGGGLVLYYRDSLNCIRRPEFEISQIETLWSEFSLPNSRPFLVCTVYRPPSAHSQWIDLFEKEISIALTTGLETILMGDFNIDYNPGTNKKWLNLVQLFDLSQLVSESTRVTETTAKIIDHIYTSHPENFTECFISYYSISDHFSGLCYKKNQL